MILETEVRIGNLVADNRGNTVEVSATLFVADMDPEGYFDLKDCNPIPISPEWLERLGFEKRESSTCIEYHIGINDVTHDWLFSLTWLLRPELIKAPDYPFYMNGRHTLFYVHQVQNLYFALTGQELTVKE